MIQTYNVEEEDENLIVCDIEMQGEKRSIKYTGKHFLALQKAIGFYDDYIKKKTDTVKMNPMVEITLASSAFVRTNANCVAKCLLEIPNPF